SEARDRETHLARLCNNAIEQPRLPVLRVGGVFCLSGIPLGEVHSIPSGTICQSVLHDPAYGESA
ncbi:MAG: hypothetical protein IKV48_05350, partial [Eggerthellaceae bacterium]|nr:hypothetical protein [Eggerthellaceae bacterium]